MRSIFHAGGVILKGATVMAIGFLAMSAQSVSAQSQETRPQTEEVQQLKDQIKQLEQAVQELRTQMAAMQQPRIGLAATTAVQPKTLPVIEQPATQPAAVAKTESEPDNPKQQKQSTFQVYGFAMLDMGYEFGQSDPNWFDVLRTSKLPASPDQFAPDGKVFYGVRQSRLGVKSSTDTPLGELKTVFEFELFGTGVDAGLTTFRLRHAYGELGHFGAGQYWSAFVDPDAFPNIIEYWGPPGLVWFRNVQFRWMPIKGSNSITVAVERPGATGDPGQLAGRVELQGIATKFELPDLTGNARFERDWGHVQISGAVRKIKWVDTIVHQFNFGGSVVGWGTALSSNLKLGARDVFRLEGLYGRGIENYMNDAPVDVGIARSESTDPARPIKGVALPVYGGSAFLDHNWSKSKRFSTSIGYSIQNIENSEGQTADSYHRGHYGIANLLYYPYENVMVGGEFQWGRRENFQDHFLFDDYRVQISLRYNFAKSFGL